MLYSSLVSKKAAIVLDHGRSIDVQLDALTDSGAVIAITDPFAVPDTFSLLFRRRTSACRVMWRQPAKIGVHFEEDEA
ncbi:PilZ domain-containing protein [Methylobacterium sp. JK268]